MSRRLPTNVTTTSAVEGWTIQAHLGPVAVHRVAGSGLFSDMFADFSDVFGGRSTAYRQQLESLYAEAIDQLIRAAEMRGGNWVVGFRADFDEISGKNKQMFMLTAVGTAVRARRDVAQETVQSHDEQVAVSGLEVTAVVRERQVLERLRAGAQIDADAWDFLTERQNPGAVSYAAKLGSTPAADDASASASRRQAAARYLRALPNDTVSSELYQLLEHDPSSTTQVLAVVTELRLGRFDRAREMLNSPNAHVRWSAFQSLRAAPATYTVGDIALLEELRSMLPTALLPRPLVTRKKMLGAKQEWECVCGGWAGFNEKCTSCGRDQFGIGPNDLRPEQADAVLASRIDALKSIYGKNTTQKK